MKRDWKGIGLIGVILAEFLAVGFDVIFNGSRIVKPIDMETYVFRGTDLPLIAATAGLVCYVFYLVIRAVVVNFRKGETAAKGVTRKLNPKFGWFGFLDLWDLWGFRFIWCRGRSGRFSFCIFRVFGFSMRRR
ncbi:hypothetical protein LC724_10415 [Blautia sp. RD014234]|nr:hypothetical protein [Blautia parvula]